MPLHALVYFDPKKYALIKTQILLYAGLNIQTGVYLLLSSASCSLTDPACTKVANKITLQLKT